MRSGNLIDLEMIRKVKISGIAVLVAVLCALAGFCLPVGAQDKGDYEVLMPDEVVFKSPEGRIYTVIDPAGLLSPGVRAETEKRLEQLRVRSSAEVEVVIPPSIGDMDANTWCVELFSRMKLGKEDKDNGLLIMISPGSKQAYISSGYGMEGIFTDIACKKIVERDIIPAMREGDLDRAVTSTVTTVTNAIDNPEAAAELQSDQDEDLFGAVKPLDSEVIMKFVRFFVGGIFLFSLFMFCFDCYKERRHQGNYSKAEMWRGDLVTYLWIGVLSLGAGLIFLLLAYLRYRSWRTRPVKCSTCGHKMKRLSEDKDNELLNDSQDFEEKLNTVDYDVWECPECGTIERFPFSVRQKKYTECPRCHTIAMCLESDAVVRPATTRHTGEGVRTYECKFCQNRIRKPYVIPKEDDGAAALAAGAVIGSALGRGGHGGGDGGGFGGFGGFGGGATGGGGAGGSW